MKSLFYNNWFFAAALFSLLLLASCGGDDDGDDGGGDEVTLTQDMLNAALEPVLSDKTGPHPVAHIEADSVIDFGHLDTLSGDETIRDIFRIPGMEGPGQLHVKKVYAKDTAGNKGDLIAGIAMFKREEGYFEAGGDWEYVVLDITTVDPATTPNGTIGATRGDLQLCADCHSAAKDNDFLFSNDQ